MGKVGKEPEPQRGRLVAILKVDLTDAGGSCSACFREFFSVARELFSARRSPCKCVGLGVLHHAVAGAGGARGQRPTGGQAVGDVSSTGCPLGAAQQLGRNPATPDCPQIHGPNRKTNGLHRWFGDYVSHASIPRCGSCAGTFSADLNEKQSPGAIRRRCQAPGIRAPPLPG